MTMIKRATCSSQIVISETVYSCPKCGHTEMLGADEAISDEANVCPDCKAVPMDIISSSSEIAEDTDKDSSNEL